MESERTSRRSIRLTEYDYSLAGMYFVTVVAQLKLCLFGHVTNEKMVLNDAGNMIMNSWLEIPNRYPYVVCDVFIVMPNHLHGILCFENEYPEKPLSLVIGSFKSLTTVSYIHGVEQYKWDVFQKRLWQRNYYEHIIRNEESLNNIRDYILYNPTHWNTDTDNPLL